MRKRSWIDWSGRKQADGCSQLAHRKLETLSLVKARQGLKEGLLIFSIGGRNLAEEKPEHVKELLKASAGSSVECVVSGADGEGTRRQVHLSYDCQILPEAMVSLQADGWGKEGEGESGRIL